MHDLVLHILRLFITFLQGVERLLANPPPVNDRSTPEPSAADATSLSAATPATTSHEEVLRFATPVTTRSPSPEDSDASTATLPISPSAYRGQRVANTLLREEYARTRTCPHYCHEARHPTLTTCPVCRRDPRTL